MLQHVVVGNFCHLTTQLCLRKDAVLEPSGFNGYWHEWMDQRQVGVLVLLHHYAAAAMVPASWKHLPSMMGLKSLGMWRPRPVVYVPLFCTTVLSSMSLPQYHCVMPLFAIEVINSGWLQSGWNACWDHSPVYGVILHSMAVVAPIAMFIVETVCTQMIHLCPVVVVDIQAAKRGAQAQIDRNHDSIPGMWYRQSIRPGSQLLRQNSQEVRSGQCVVQQEICSGLHSIYVCQITPFMTALRY